jgi:hypothetical protein
MFLGWQVFLEKVLLTLVEKGNICVANIGFMFINHLHFLFMDVEGGSWYFYNCC